MFGWNETACFAFVCGAALKGTVVLGAAWTLCRLLRGRSAAVRHLVWTAAAAALLALPFLSASLPALRVAVPAVPSVTFRTAGSAGSEAPPAPAAPSRVAARLPDTSSRPLDWRLWLMAFWAAGTALAFGRMLAAYAAAYRIRRSATPSADGELCARLARAMGAGRVRVFEIRRGGMPMSFGVLRPAVFLPRDAAEWSEERRRLVLWHELAHIWRGDAATHLLARAAFSLYWWNPLAWAAWREFLKERERAADDLVLAWGARASDYAGHLLEIARSLRPVAATAWAAVSMARRSELEGRLLAILDSGADRRSPGRAGILAAALLAIAMAAPLASIRAQDQPAQAAPADVEATMRAANSQRNPEMLDRAAAAFEALRKYDTAWKLRQAALDLRGRVFGQQSKEYQAGLIKLGDLGAHLGKFDIALKDYAEAVALGDNPGTAGAFVCLAMDACKRKDFGAATSFLERGLRVAAGGAETGRVLTWMAVVRQAQPDGAAEAESLYTQALAAEDPASPEAATTMELYVSGILRPSGRTAEADPMEERARAIRKAHVEELSPKRTGSVPAVKVGSGSSAPVLVSKVEPAYTEEARAMKIQGTVVLKVVVGTDGTAAGVQLVKGVGLGLD